MTTAWCHRKSADPAGMTPSPAPNHSKALGLRAPLGVVGICDPRSMIPLLLWKGEQNPADVHFSTLRCDVASGGVNKLVQLKTSHSHALELL